MNSKRIIRIGTRGSELALWQAHYVRDILGKDNTEVIIIKTQGDKIQNVSFDKMEGKGFFTKEIEDSLIGGDIDLAVHSLKDLPTEMVPELMIAAIPERENPSDILLIKKESFQRDRYIPLSDNAVIGTSSLRRAAQMLHENKSFVIEPIRGNVNTRLRKLREGHFDAIILAYAGLKRINIDISDLVAHVLPYSFFLPAPAQGALALQVRKDDTELQEMLRPLTDPATASAIESERAFLQHFGGGCHIPIGAYAYIENGTIHLSGMVAAQDGSRLIRKNIEGTDPGIMGKTLADMLKKEGAEELL
ncbi:MAG TPA: hydroxymethylbilane synthase [Spirochaetota bacterium]|nr:hydroxymethylbilane synthase [Spirochaetota bacterium]